MTGARLTVTGVSKSFGLRPVLAGVDLTVGPGSVMAVTGRNGSGKSTLLRCVAGLARHQGSILVDDAPPESVRERIGYLPQTIGFPGWATVGEVIEYFARLRRVDPGSHPFEPHFVPDAGLPVKVLSGGQVQRVALAVTLLGRPDLVLLDEPAASLDDAGRRSLEKAIGDAAVEGASVVMATPRTDDLSRIFDEVVDLVDGRVESRPESTVTPLKVVSP